MCGKYYWQFGALYAKARLLSPNILKLVWADLHTLLAKSKSAQPNLFAGMHYFLSADRMYDYAQSRQMLLAASIKRQDNTHVLSVIEGVYPNRQPAQYDLVLFEFTSSYDTHLAIGERHLSFLDDKTRGDWQEVQYDEKLVALSGSYAKQPGIICKHLSFELESVVGYLHCKQIDPWLVELAWSYLRQLGILIM